MELLKNISEISFLISIVFVLYKLLRFLGDAKLPVVRAFFVNITLLNSLYFLVFLWAFLKELAPLTINDDIDSIKFIFDTLTFFVAWSVPLSFFVFIYMIFSKRTNKFQYTQLLVPAILILSPKVAAWLEVLIFNTSYILNSLYGTTDLLVIIAMILASIYLRYRASHLSDKNIKISLNRLSITYLIPYIFIFFATIIYPSIKIPDELNGIIGPWIFILFNLGIILWISKYKQVFTQYFIEPEAKPSSDLEKFVSKYEITSRELDVIKLICTGKTNKEIADQLFISISTVKDHNYKIYQKLNIKNRTQLMKMFFEF